MGNTKDSRNRGFVEKAHLHTNMDNYSEGYDRIFGKKTEAQILICPECKSSGFSASKSGKGCEFCDGTEGGQDVEVKTNGEVLSKEQNDKELYEFNYGIKKTQNIYRELSEWKTLAQEASDELATFKAEIKEDMSFVLSLATYCTQQTAVKIEEIKKKYI